MEDGIFGFLFSYFKGGILLKDQGSISKKTFLSAIIILFVLLIGAGILTQVIPMGHYQYVERDGQMSIVPDSFSFSEGARLPVYKWFTAPVEVLGGKEGTVVLMIILFLLIIGGAIHVLNEAQVLKTLIDRVVFRFKDKKYGLLCMVILIFMALGAFVGIFEEIIPLVPIMISLSLALGFDVMTGLGISLLATGMGFAAAVSNPFTVGVAQKVADVPLFSGSGYRLLIFFAIYGVISLLIVRHAKKHQTIHAEGISVSDAKLTKGARWFLGWMLVMAAVLIMAPFVPLISSLNLPLIALIFLAAGLGSGFLSDFSAKKVFQSFGKGMMAMLPGVILILLATGVKHIIQTGNIMDTILYYASQKVMHASPFVSVLLIYALVFILNFFIGSGSAKAFIVMPIIAPLMDMIGVSRQLSVLAFQFGDGFSNILYPTNAVLLIGIGLAGVSYTKWLKWVIRYQVLVGLLSVLFLWIGLQIGY